MLHDVYRHDDVGLRVTATKNLARIAKALGPERTKEELIPFLVDSTDDEDEVLLVMAEAIGGSHVDGAVGHGGRVVGEALDQLRHTLRAGSRHGWERSCC